jgi:hypothetical protein
MYGFARTCCFALFQTSQPLYKDWARLPHDLCGLLQKCLADDPKDRPADFTEILDSLTRRAQPEKAARKPGKSKPILELEGNEAAILDDFCAADALKKMAEKLQKEKKERADEVAWRKAVELWFAAKSQPDNPSLQTGSSKANLIINEGRALPLPSQPDGSPIAIKDWFLGQGLDADLAGRIAANEKIHTEEETVTLDLGRLLAGSADQRAVAEKLIRLALDRLLPLIAGIHFTDGGQQFAALVSEHCSPAEQALCQQTESLGQIPDGLLERAASYCETPEQLSQLLTLLKPTIYLSHIKYSGSFDRVTEALLREQ